MYLTLEDKAPQLRDREITDKEKETTPLLELISLRINNFYPFWGVSGGLILDEDFCSCLVVGGGGNTLQQMFTENTM